MGDHGLWATYPIRIDFESVEVDLEDAVRAASEFGKAVVGGEATPGVAQAFANRSLEVAVASFGLGEAAGDSMQILGEAARALRAFWLPDPGPSPDWMPLYVGALAGDLDLLAGIAARDLAQRLQGSAGWASEAGVAEGWARLAIASGDRDRAQAAVQEFRAACNRNTAVPAVIRFQSPVASLFEVALGMAPQEAAVKAVLAICEAVTRSRRGTELKGVASLYHERGLVGLALARLAGLDPLPEDCPYLLAPLVAELEPGALWARRSG